MGGWVGGWVDNLLSDWDEICHKNLGVGGDCFKIIKFEISVFILNSLPFSKCACVCLFSNTISSVATLLFTQKS